MTTINADKLQSLLDFSDRNRLTYEVYTSNVDGDGYFWEWLELSESIVETVRARQIVVANFRTRTREKYSLREPRPQPVVLYAARPTSKKYKHTVAICLYKKNRKFK